MPIDISRLIRNGNSLCVVIPAKMVQSLRWNVGDRIAMRYAEGKLILDRVPVEGLAKLKAGEINGN